VKGWLAGWRADRLASGGGEEETKKKKKKKKENLQQTNAQKTGALVGGGLPSPACRADCLCFLRWELQLKLRLYRSQSTIDGRMAKSKPVRCGLIGESNCSCALSFSFSLFRQLLPDENSNCNSATKDERNRQTRTVSPRHQLNSSLPSRPLLVSRRLGSLISLCGWSAAVNALIARKGGGVVCAGMVDVGER
jgi:hypothetical protein